MSMEGGLGFRDLVHNYSHFITSVLHNFGSALYYQCCRTTKTAFKDIQLILVIQHLYLKN